jgi:hypothetical protein
MKLIIVSVALLIATIASNNTFAQATPKVHAHQVHQKERIKEGVQSGELNRKEATRLRAEQAKIQAEKKVAKADGVVTPAERQVIKQDQKKASKHIYNQKHDAQVRH